MKRIGILTALIWISLLAVGQKLTSQERKIIATVDKHIPQAVAFLEESVNINSGTMNKPGVERAGAHMRKAFDAIGLTTRWITLPPELNRSGHLFAEKKGTKGKRLLLIGHLDTVFEPESPFQQYKQQDSIAYGPGTNDMKGGNIVILFALKALHELNLLRDAQIIVALHGDEEAAGRPLSISRADIIEAAKRSDVALAFETGTGFGEATIARRGTTNWMLEVSGKQAHSAGVFSANVGAGAIYEASRILSSFYNQLREEYLTFNAGMILGGTAVTTDSTLTYGTVSGKTNIVASKAVVTGDIRYLSDEQRERTKKKMMAIVSAHLPHTHAKIVFDDGYPAMPPTEGNLTLLNAYSQVSVDMGLGPVKPYDPGKRGAGDISFVAQYLDCLDGLGAMGGGAHSPNEFIDLRTLDEQIKRAAILIYRLTR
jgi:glutamate carboxypeptidase